MRMSRGSRITCCMIALYALQKARHSVAYSGGRKYSHSVVSKAESAPFRMASEVKNQTTIDLNHPHRHAVPSPQANLSIRDYKIPSDYSSACIATTIAPSPSFEFSFTNFGTFLLRY
ncbi:uncharacterized protein BDR25DRAFT_352068 [Lindgomyces ingoldianus]|uniref:Uncharacterized protein n=1 Tax=Lindgomyces ingoldianus TaxID=673940 RepID=A0ACB6R5J7_9PLEO|nr:uncharacterized protein BDR25DRAFT_352068 [Lindgomyces ingoldianus]KAF2473572.1 hypothetical protein BDR25DRAFT_352068 [Lindgomyces ingoldianus]